MKKTLLAALAFVMVLATVLTCSVLAADEPAAAPMKAADIKMVDAAHPILVDGKMDQAYEDATALYVDMFPASVSGIYTYGIARFVWSPTENAVYCFMIVNDADIGEPLYRADYGCVAAWVSDSVELYVDFTQDGLVPAGGYGPHIPEGMNYERGMQYRIDGYNGKPSCLLVEEPAKFKANNPGWTHPVTQKSPNVYNGMYFLNEDTKKFENMLDSAMTEYFGWSYSEEETKIGWGRQRTEYGYTAEFRIECKERELAAGDKVFFDIQGNDMYEDIRRANSENNTIFYYSSQLRTQSGNPSATRPNYDWLVLSDEVATNDNKPMEVDDKRMEDFGMEDVSEGRSVKTELTELTQTTKRTWSRRPIGAVVPGDGDNQQGGGNQQGGNNQQGGSGTAEEPAGGCGSSITVSASVAMVAAVALGGAFAFRRKDEE